MSKKYGIEIPPYTAFKVKSGVGEKMFVGVPRQGCDICAMRKYDVCRIMCCSMFDRVDKEAVQYVEINIPSSEIVLHVGVGGATTENKKNGGEE